MSTSDEEWRKALTVALIAELEEFENPPDRPVEHDHRWELSEVNDHFVVWECLDCRAVRAEA